MLKPQNLQEVFTPDGAELLSVHNQNGFLCLWAVVDPSNKKRPRLIEIIGTGIPIVDLTGLRRKFIGTVLSDAFVWHVFEQVEVK